MATVHDVASYILLKMGSMTAMKLQKLVYYSQAASVAQTGRPLFDEPILAWAHGPVVYELFDLHRGRFVVREPWPKGSPFALLRGQQAIVDEVIEKLGDLSAQVLSEMTHQDLPWQQARAGTPEGWRGSEEISLESMREFYSRADAFGWQ